MSVTVFSSMISAKPTHISTMKKKGLFISFTMNVSPGKWPHVLWKGSGSAPMRYKAVLALIESHMRIFLISDNESREKAVRRLVYKMGDLTPSLILHTMCDMYGSSGGIDNPSTEQVKKCCEEILEAYRESLKEPLPRLLNGNDLIALGFVQGPAIGSCLD